MTPKSQPLDQNRCSESGNEPMRKTASAQSTRNTFEYGRKNMNAQGIKMTEFLNGAQLVRTNYKDWQELVKTLMEHPKTEEYGSLVFIENKSELVFGLWLSTYCGVFNLDPSYPFTCQSGPVPLEQKTTSLGDPLHESFSLEVGYMWIRLGEPDCRVNKDSIRERIRLAELQIEPSTRLRAEVTTAKMLSGIYRRWSVPITVRGLDGSTLMYQVFLDRSVEVIELETNGEEAYLRIIEDLFPHCLQPIVKRSRERSNYWAEQVRLLESNVRDAERFAKSNMIHPAIWDSYKHDDSHIAGSAANHIIPVVGSNVDNSTSIASKTDNDIDSVTIPALQPSSEPQSNTNGRRHRVIAEPEDATKAQLISDLKQPRSNEVARAPRQSGRTRASEGKAVGHEPQSDNVRNSALLPRGSKARASEGEFVRCEPLSNNVASLVLWPQPRELQSNITKGRRGKRYYERLSYHRPRRYFKLREIKGTAIGRATGDRKQPQLIEPQGGRAQASKGEDVGSETRRWRRLFSSGPVHGII